MTDLVARSRLRIRLPKQWRLLAAPEFSKRLGEIDALRGSLRPPEQDATAVMEVLTGHVRTTMHKDGTAGSCPRFTGGRDASGAVGVPSTFKRRNHRREKPHRDPRLDYPDLSYVRLTRCPVPWLQL